MTFRLKTGWEGRGFGGWGGGRWGDRTIQKEDIDQHVGPWSDPVMRPSAGTGIDSVLVSCYYYKDADLSLKTFGVCCMSLETASVL